MKYTFSEETKIQLYGKDLYAIMEGEKIVAYCEVKFVIPKEVRFLGSDQAYIFKGATIRGGDFWGGTFWGGDFWGGDFSGGDFRGGTFRGGDFWGGTFWGGTFRGGDFWGGDFWGGTFWGGDFWGGDFRGGTFRGGDFWGGTFWGGDFWGGDFRGGDFWGGDYGVTLLQIQGSRHFCYLEKTDEGGLLLGIGCEKHPINEWKKNYAQIGESESYSPDEIAEYKEYIDLYDRIYQPKTRSTKKAKQ